MIADTGFAGLQAFGRQLHAGCQLQWLGDSVERGNHLLALLARRVRRTVRFFFTCSLVPLFFCCPVAVRSLSGCLSGCLSGFIACGLIFVVIADGYDRPALSGFLFDHLFGFQSGQKPLDRARRPSPRARKLGPRGAELAALKGHDAAADVERRRLPARLRDHPEKRAEPLTVLQDRMFECRAVEDDEPAHPSSPRAFIFIATLRTRIPKVPMPPQPLSTIPAATSCFQARVSRWFAGSR